MRIFTFLVAMAILPILIPNTSLAYSATGNFTFNEISSKPTSFKQDNLGGFYGLTEDGYSFTQKPIVTNTDLRIHKFVINETFFYISDRGVFLAKSDLAALSVYYSIG